MYASARAAVAEAVRRRQIKNVVYFHCDHFEPWRDARGGVSERNAADVVQFGDATGRLDFARKLTLFYKCNIPTTMNRSPRTVFMERDQLGFIIPSERELRTTRSAMRHIAHETKHELQVHIHHEFFTGNNKYCLEPAATREFFKTANTKELDQQRFRLGLRLSLDLIRQEAEIPLKNWYFVHGTWALNASDQDVCTITNEIELLREQGCRGDFTFPAGRQHCDPDYDQPVFIDPVNAPKGYALPEANAEPAHLNTLAAERGKFFVWASEIDAKGSSIDYYWDHVRRRCEDVKSWALELVARSVCCDGTLYVKTHAHSMYMYYFEGVSRVVHPHEHPGIQNLLCLLFDAASEAGASVEFLTASEVYGRFVDGPRATEVATPRSESASGVAAEIVEEAPPPMDEAEFKATYEAAVKAYQAGDAARSCDEFEKIKRHLKPDSYVTDHYYYYQLKNLGLSLNRADAALRLSDEAIRARPDYGPIWFMRGVLLRNAGRSLEAFAALKKAFKLGSEKAHAAYYMATILHAAKRCRLALALAEFAVKDGVKPRGFEQTLAELYLAVGRPTESLARLDELGRNFPPDDHKRQLRSYAEAMQRQAFRHVAIGGAIHANASALGAWLGAVEGASYIGATQALIALMDPTTNAVRPIDFAHDGSEAVPHCEICGPSCQVLTPEFRQSLQRDPTDWYRRIARRIGAGVLISSDRLPADYRLKAPWGDLDLVVVYESPETWIGSILSEKRANEALGEPSGDDVVSWLDDWCLSYEALMKDVRRQRRIVLDWDRFAAKQDAHIARLLHLLDLPGDATILQKMRLDHVIGTGDGEAHRRTIAERRIHVPPAPTVPLTAAVTAAIQAHRKSQRLVRQLDFWHEKLFGDL